MGQLGSTTLKKIRSPHEISREFVNEDVQTLEKQAPKQSDHRQMSWKQKYTSGWRTGALLCCTTATIILLINVIVLVWTASNYTMENGIGTLYKGSCAKAKSLNTWLQLLINILCTVLLGSSNYCMQCLTSPTRDEIDNAHGRKRLLRIGVPSLRNLRFISGYRVFVWVCLGLSALPIHFLYAFMPHHNFMMAHTSNSYNSAVFITTQANSYTVLASPSSFFDKRFNDTDFYSSDDTWNDALGFAQDMRARIEHPSNFEPLAPKQCIEAYMHQYVSKWGDLLLLQQDWPLYRSSIYHYKNDSCLNRVTEDLAWSGVSGEEQGHLTELCYQSEVVEGFWNNVTFKWQQFTDPAISSRLGSGWSLTHVRHVFSNSTDGVNTSLIFSSLPTSYPSNQWQCSGSASECSPTIYLANATQEKTWKPFGSTVSRCLAEKIPERCTLNLSLHFGLVVVACNITKVFCMFWVFRHHKMSALMTTGDAINSFLNDPDQTTSGLCLYSSAKMYLHWEWQGDSFETSLQWKLLKQIRLGDLKMPVHKVERWCWGQAASVMRWIMCLTL